MGGELFRRGGFGTAGQRRQRSFAYAPDCDQKQRCNGRPGTALPGASPTGGKQKACPTGKGHRPAGSQRQSSSQKAAPETSKPEEPKEAALPKEPERQPSRPRQVARLRNPPPENPAGNEIPLGQGGPAQGPYGIFQTEAGAGGFGFTESAGNFAERYGWYVTAIRNRISNNWLKGTVNPNIRVAPRVYVTFQILRDGRIANSQLTSSSGLASLDRSALRAIYDSSPMPPLPADYLAPSVAVEFWFDFRR